jgi:hypothetical protein
MVPLAQTNLFQLYDITQHALLLSEIDITNSGFIDPAIGILGRINNVGVVLGNSATVSNTNGVSTTDDVTQQIKADQANAIESSIVKNNLGNIAATQTGMLAEIENGPIGALGNSIVSTNANGTAGPISIGVLFQGALLQQANTLSSEIDLTNAGAIDSNAGIVAAIGNNFSAAFGNSIVHANGNGTAQGVTLSDLTQSEDFDQTNTLMNGITIVQSGRLKLGSVGIEATIDNAAIGVLGNSIVANNGNGIAAGVTLSLFDQDFDAAQNNVLHNGISIENAGNIDASSGILASIANDFIGAFGNSAVVSNLYGNVGVISAEAGTQSVGAQQGNSIANTISLLNTASLDTGNRGISAVIDTENVAGLGNTATLGNADGVAAVIDVDSLSQTIAAQQTNAVESGIFIDNRGSFSSSTGIRAQITNRSFAALSNDIVASNLAGAASLINRGDQTQDINITQANEVASSVAVANGGEINASGAGIVASIDNQTLTLDNTINLTSNALGSTATISGDVSQNLDFEQSNTVSNSISIFNTGSVTAGGVAVSAQIFNQGINLTNTLFGIETSGAAVNGDVTQTARVTQTNTLASNIAIANSGTIKGGTLGIYASIPDATFNLTDIGSVTLDSGQAPIPQVNSVESGILIDNSGSVSAKSHFAINTDGASTTIINRANGVITGYINLTDKADIFRNLEGGSFVAQLTSDFGGGGDLFVNRGFVYAASGLSTQEQTRFVALETFENSGVISLRDDHAGDSFEIFNTVGARDLTFVASDGSLLDVDAFLAGPSNSVSDTFTINGNVSGQTELQVYNTNPNGGAYNTRGIPVVYVNGDVDKDAFYLTKPVDAGFFDYDLFFRPTGSGVFELKSVPGGGAHVLPHLLTSVQDVFHTGEETWFDRSADLRVFLNSGARQAPLPYDGVPGTSITPAFWARGAANWVGRDGNETTTGNGRTYSYKLDNDLGVQSFQSGIDFGKQDLLSQGDILVFGLLGGWVHADLDFDGVNRFFDMSGVEAGAYATYLKGGLFVDTLLKADILNHEQEIVGFPGSLDVRGYGVRTDAGYRFGSFRGGPFIEPLATLGVIWTDFQDFATGDNKVNFDSDPNLRGRIGLRAGTGMALWPGITMEPFVVASLWGDLAGDRTAKLTSNDVSFTFEDDPQDVWGEVSAGLNVFNPSAHTSLFAKFDLTFGDDLEGFGGKAGARVSW